MTILIEAPKDNIQQYTAWMPEQPGGSPMVGTGCSPDEALEDLRSMIQNLIDGCYEDENDLIQAKELLPGLYDIEFQIFVEPGINFTGSLYFNLVFDNYIFP